jgi:hypothetical protein
MAKDNKAKNETVAVKGKKPKSAAAVAKAAHNVAEAAKRLRMLQEKQKLAHDARRLLGLVGTDDQIMAKVNAMKSQQDRIAETRNAMVFVENCLAGPHGAAIRKSLNLTGEPCKVAARVREFVRVQGTPPDNFRYSKAV